jgi:hypothetical protein
MNKSPENLFKQGKTYHRYSKARSNGVKQTFDIYEEKHDVKVPEVEEPVTEVVPEEEIILDEPEIVSNTTETVDNTESTEEVLDLENRYN